MGSYFDESDPLEGFTGGFQPQKTGGVIGHAAGIAEAINPETAFLTTGKVMFDTFQTGAWIGNSINSAGLNPALSFEATTEEDILIDHTKEFWEATSTLNGKEFNTYTTGVANMGAFVGTTMSFASKIAALPKFAKLAKSSGFWNGIKKSFFIGGTAGAGADLIHTRASDTRVLEMIPEDSRPEFLHWMVDRTNETELEGRVKNMLEGVALGMGIDTGFEIFRAFKSSKNMLHKLSESPQELKDNLLDTMGDGEFNEDLLTAYRDEAGTGRVVTNDELPHKGPDINKTEVEVHQETAPSQRKVKKRAAKKRKAKEGVVKIFDPRVLDNIDTSDPAVKVRAIVNNFGDSEQSSRQVAEKTAHCRQSY